MAPRRHDDRLGTRRPGAGRPRKIPRTSERPVVEEVIGAASRLFARQGFATTTMADIARAAGLQVSSVYYYFGSKDEILERIVAEVNRVPLDLLHAARGRFADPPRRLHAFVRADAAALCRFPFDINEIHRLAGASDEAFAPYWHERRQLEDEVTAVVAAGVDTGVFVDVAPTLAALTILANDEAAQNWYRPPRPRVGEGDVVASVTPAAVGGFLADLTLRGLLVDPGQVESIRAETAPAEGGGGQSGDS